MNATTNKTERLTFVYLLFTVSDDFPTPVMTGIYRSVRAVKKAMPDHQMVEPRGSDRTVAQCINETNGQIWYAEKHVVRS